MYTVNSRRISKDLHLISGCVLIPQSELPDQDGNFPDWYVGGKDIHAPFIAYVINGDKSLIYDTCPPNMTSEMLTHLSNILEGDDLDYIVVSHPEAPHGGNAGALLDQYPDADLIVPSAGSLHDLHVGTSEFQRASHGDCLDLGKYQVEFHDPILFDLASTIWMFETNTKTLFPSDGYGYPHMEHECGQFTDELLATPENVIDRWMNFHNTSIPWLAYADPQRYEVLTENLVQKYNPSILAPAHGLPMLNDASKYIQMIVPTIEAIHEQGFASEESERGLI